MATIVPCFNSFIDLIGLVDGVDRCLDVPQVFQGNVLADTTELALDGNALVVVRSGLDGVERSTALRVSIVMVIMPVTKAVVVPA